MRVGAALVLAAAASCGPRSIPERLRELPPDFKRVPYLQAVAPDSAIVVWQTHVPTSASLNYWSGDSTQKPNVADTTVALDHVVALRGLTPDTEYSYQVETWEGRFTEARSFRTAPLPGSRKPFVFLVFGDSGEGTEGQLLLADRMPAEDAALSIHVGDVAYDNGSETDFDFRVFAVYADLFGSVGFFPSLGNHDIRTELGRPYLDAFHLPANNPAGTERYYSFQHDNVVFVALDSNTGPMYTARFGDLRDAASEQRRWLEGELARVRSDSTVDWIVVYMHHALFSSGGGVGGHGSDLGLQSSLVPLFDRYRVDLVLTGHDHHYERSVPIRCEEGGTVGPGCAVATANPQVVEQGSGTVYVVTGGGGGPFAWRAVGVGWWTAFARQVYQYVTVAVGPEGLGLRSVDAQGNAFDEVLVRRREPQPGAEAPRGVTPAAPVEVPAPKAGGAAAPGDAPVPPGEIPAAPGDTLLPQEIPAPGEENPDPEPPPSTPEDSVAPGAPAQPTTGPAAQPTAGSAAEPTAGAAPAPR